MTRTTDDLNPERFQPLGPKVMPPPAPAPQPRRIAPGIVQNEDGRLRTDLPPPKD